MLLFRLSPEACKRRSYYLDKCPAVCGGTVVPNIVFLNISPVSIPWVFACELTLSLPPWEELGQSMARYIEFFLSLQRWWLTGLVSMSFLNPQRVPEMTFACIGNLCKWGRSCWVAKMWIPESKVLHNLDLMVPYSSPFEVLMNHSYDLQLFVGFCQ